MEFAAKHIACVKGEKYLFRNLSFSLTSGHLALVQGPNGAGKSSLLKILAGLSHSQKGSCEWHDASTASIAFLGHKDGLRQVLSARENIHLQLTLSQTPVVTSIIDDYCKHLALTQVMDLSCQYLSQGQRRKVALCALLLKQRLLWILDEPFTALDKASSEWLQCQFQQHLAQGGLIILSSHAPISMKADVVVDLAEYATC